MHPDEFPSRDLCIVGCTARTMFRRASLGNIELVRHRLPRAFRELLSRGVFLLKKYSDAPIQHRAVEYIKLFDSTSENDHVLAVKQRTIMLKRKEVSVSELATLDKIIGGIREYDEVCGDRGPSAEA